MNENTAAAVSEQEVYKKRSQFRTVARRFARNKLAMAGLILLTILVIVVCSLDLFMDYDTMVVKQNMKDRLMGPFESTEHILGTDQYGRDLLARILYGARISLTATVCVILISTVLAIMISSVSAYFGGKVDNILMRITDVFYALPFYLLAICIVAALGGGVVNLVIACVFGATPGVVRVSRSYMLPLRNQEYVEAAIACGTGSMRILKRHIIPNAIGPIIVQATLSLSETMLAISGLSFIGLGVQAPMPSLGSLANAARGGMQNYPWKMLFPALSICLIVLSFNLLGDGLRDAFDPKLRR